MTGSIAADATAKAVATNTYTATGTAQLKAHKTLEGYALVARQFGFTVKNEAGETVATAENDADGNVTFPTFTYTADDIGTHTYTINEVGGGTTASGVTFDDAAYTATVTVSDNGDGTLSTQIAYAKDGQAVDAAEFTNTYHSAGEINLTAAKHVSAGDIPAGAFEFQVLDEDGKQLYLTSDGELTTRADGNVPLVEVNGADGLVIFPSIPVKEPGTHTFMIREMAGNDTAHWRYDDHVERVTTTTQEIGAGLLYTSYEYENGNASFTNVPVVAVSASKAWLNNDGSAEAPEGAEVTFELYANGEPTGKTVKLDGTIDADGETQTWTAEWTNLEKYDADGNEIAYTISETKSLEKFHADAGSVENGGTITNVEEPEDSTPPGEDTPNISSSTPGTGDTTLVQLLLVIALAALSTLAASFVHHRRKLRL